MKIGMGYDKMKYHIPYFNVKSDCQNILADDNLLFEKNVGKRRKEH